MVPVQTIPDWCKLPAGHLAPYAGTNRGLQEWKRYAKSDGCSSSNEAQPGWIFVEDVVTGWIQ